jgi:hypothetical protein
LARLPPSPSRPSRRGPPRHGARPRPARRGRGARDSPSPLPPLLVQLAATMQPSAVHTAPCPSQRGSRPRRSARAPCPRPGTRSRPAPAAALACAPSPQPQRAPAPGSLARHGAAAPTGPSMPVARSSAWLAPGAASLPTRGAQRGVRAARPWRSTGAAARWPTCCARSAGMARGALAQPARLE